MAAGDNSFHNVWSIHSQRLFVSLYERTKKRWAESVHSFPLLRDKWGEQCLSQAPSFFFFFLWQASKSQCRRNSCLRRSHRPAAALAFTPRPFIRKASAWSQPLPVFVFAPVKRSNAIAEITKSFRLLRVLKECLSLFVVSCEPWRQNYCGLTEAPATAVPLMVT